jgi:uncharacterized ion transporter superfamily protein YfcC
MWYRLICFAIFVSIGIHHVWSYAKRVKLDPAASLVADIKAPAGAAIPSSQDATALGDLEPMTSVQKRIMTAVGAAMVLLIYGMIAWKWGLFEMQGLFAGLVLVIAILARMRAAWWIPWSTASAFLSRSFRAPFPPSECFSYKASSTFLSRREVVRPT